MGDVDRSRFTQRVPIDRSRFTQRVPIDRSRFTQRVDAPPPPPEAPPADVSSADAAGRGLAQGLTLKFGDELSAGLIRGVDALTGREDAPRAADPSGRIDPNGPTPYQRLRDSMRANDEQARASHPVAYGGAEMFGGAVTTAPLAYATGGASLGQQMGINAGIGAASGAGASTSEDAEGVAWDALSGAEVGAAMPLAGAAVAAAGTGIRNVGGEITNAALARRGSSYLNVPAARKAAQMRGGPVQFGRDTERLGLHNAARGPLGFLPPSTEAVAAEHVPDLLARVGSGMDAIATRVSSPAVIEARTVRNLTQELGSLADHESDAYRAVGAAIEGANLHVTAGASSAPMPFLAALRIRSEVGRLTDWSPGATTAANENLRAIYGNMTKAMNGALERTNPAMREAWTQLNHDYQVAKILESGSGARAAGIHGSNIASLGANLAAGGALAGGSLPAAAASAGLHMATRGRGKPLAAAAMRMLGNATEGAGMAAQVAGTGMRYEASAVTAELGAANSRRRERSTADSVRSLATTNPQALGEYGPRLAAAAQRSPLAFGTLHYYLSQTDPAYRAAVRNATE